ncbi:maltose operon protein MalM [Edwardsiella tarda]|uniref:maltose operon protein MalM n=1 Tax=Edwardsiella tarda TaxID=636 RepID=UPI00351C3B0C
MKNTVNRITRGVLLACALCVSLPALADTLQPTDVAAAPELSRATLQSLHWQPLTPPTDTTITLGPQSQTLNQGEIQGAVAALALPANRGSLEITLSSRLHNKQLYVPNVLVLDQHLRPAAYYPGNYFTYRQPGVMSGDRLEGTMKLTPVLGQQQIYLLIYTTRQDLTTKTQMVNPAKAYAAGVGNAVPDIPDPYASHAAQGVLTIQARVERQSGNVMIGALLPSGDTPADVVVGGQSSANGAPQSAPASMAPPSEPMLAETAAYFDQSIRSAVRQGNIDKALRLMNEAERLGSTTARETFIRSVKGKG